VTSGSEGLGDLNSEGADAARRAHDQDPHARLGHAGARRAGFEPRRSRVPVRVCRPRIGGLEPDLRQRRVLPPGHGPIRGPLEGVAARGRAAEKRGLEPKTRWRDPNSNRGHHDFQSCGAGAEPGGVAGPSVGFGIPQAVRVFPHLRSFPVQNGPRRGPWAFSPAFIRRYRRASGEASAGGPPSRSGR
jgi:hypothetical protein